MTARLTVARARFAASRRVRPIGRFAPPAAPTSICIAGSRGAYALPATPDDDDTDNSGLKEAPPEQD